MSSTKRRLRRIGGAWVVAALLALAIGALAAYPAHATAIDDATAALKPGGRVILMRHAQTTPGVGDPDNFRLGDCTTQRNLDDRGRAQSVRLGQALGAAGITITSAQSSAWCRCIDSARIMLDAAGLKNMAVVNLPALDSTWDEGSAEARDRAKAVRETIAAWAGPGTLLLMTHGVNVAAITGRSLPQGGFFVLAPKSDGFEVIAQATP